MAKTGTNKQRAEQIELMLSIAQLTMQLDTEYLNGLITALIRVDTKDLNAKSFNDLLRYKETLNEIKAKIYPELNK